MFEGDKFGEERKINKLRGIRAGVPRFHRVVRAGLFGKVRWEREGS